MSKFHMYGLRNAQQGDYAWVRTKVWAFLFTWDGEPSPAAYRRVDIDARNFGVRLFGTCAEERAGTRLITHKNLLWAMQGTHTPLIVVDHFTPSDVLTIIYRPEWVEGAQYEFSHNGVRVQEDRATELIG